MSSHGVSLCCPSNDFSGLSRASMSVPFTVSITMRFGSKIARLSCPGKSTVRRSFRVSAVNTTFLRESPLPLTNQIAPVIDAATLIAFTLFQRSRPPCALTAKSNSSLLASSFVRDGLLNRQTVFGIQNHRCCFHIESPPQKILFTSTVFTRYLPCDQHHRGAVCP